MMDKQTFWKQAGRYIMDAYQYNKGYVEVELHAPVGLLQEYPYYRMCSVKVGAEAGDKLTGQATYQMSLDDYKTYIEPLRAGITVGMRVITPQNRTTIG